MRDSSSTTVNVNPTVETEDTAAWGLDMVKFIQIVSFSRKREDQWKKKLRYSESAFSNHRDNTILENKFDKKLNGKRQNVRDKSSLRRNAR